MLRTLAVLAILPFTAPASSAATWDDLAARFGCTNKAHAAEQGRGTQYIMEWVPKGQKLNEQERMFTVTLVKTSAVEAEAIKHVDEVIRSIADVTKRSGAKIFAFTGYKGDHGNAAYFEFELKGEYNVGVIQRSSQGIIAIQQLATFKGRTPTDTDRAAVKAILGVK
jgi:hypothetical protein